MCIKTSAEYEYILEIMYRLQGTVTRYGIFSFNQQNQSRDHKIGTATGPKPLSNPCTRAAMSIAEVSQLPKSPTLQRAIRSNLIPDWILTTSYIGRFVPTPCCLRLLRTVGMVKCTITAGHPSRDIDFSVCRCINQSLFWTDTDCR